MICVKSLGWLAAVTTIVAGTLLSPKSAAAVAPAALPQTPPDMTLRIQPHSGNCPSSVSLWTNSAPAPDAGGQKVAALLDTTAIATAPAEFMDSRDRVVIFAAPLQSRYAACTGWVSSPGSPQYNIWLQFGYVYFRFDLDAIPGDRASEIVYQDIVEGRPYVQWVIPN